MKRILLPTDFSKTSTSAMHYGIQMFYGEEYEIVVLNAYEIPIPSGDQAILPENYVEQLMEHSKSGLENVKERIEENHPNLSAKIIMESRLGTVRRAISEYLEENDVDLIIMGTHGTSGMGKFFLGSNTYDVIKNVSVPVLSIPDNYDFKSISKITLAMDFNSEINPKTFEILIWMAKKFEARVNVLNVLLPHESKEDSQSSIQEQLDEFLNQVDHDFMFRENDSVEEGIKEFMDNNNSELLTMVLHKHSFLENLFHSSVTRKIALEAKLPLLTIHA